MIEEVFPVRDDDPELLGLLELMTKVLRDFAGLADSDIDLAIDDALRAISEFGGVDRSYLVLQRDDEPEVIDNTHEWCAPGISSEKENLQGLPWDLVGPWVEVFEAGEPVYIPRVSALPEGRRDERELLESQGIQSLIVVPLIGPEGLQGFLGFDASSGWTWGKATTSRGLSRRSWCPATGARTTGLLDRGAGVMSVTSE